MISVDMKTRLVPSWESDRCNKCILIIYTLLYCFVLILYCQSFPYTVIFLQIPIERHVKRSRSHDSSISLLYRKKCAFFPYSYDIGFRIQGYLSSWYLLDNFMGRYLHEQVCVLNTRILCNTLDMCTVI